MNWFFGTGGGLTRSDLEDSIRRDKFSDYLPYLSWNDEDTSFELVDGSFGYFWEMTPVTLMGSSLQTTLQSFLSLSWPAGVSISISLFADPDIGGLEERFRAIKVRPDELIQRNVAEYCRWLEDQRHGLDSMFDIPIRNFRSFLSVKCKSRLNSDIRKQIEETLKYFLIRAAGPSVLLPLLRRVFNQIDHPFHGAFDTSRPLRKQIIESASGPRFDGSNVHFGKHVGRCLTLKSLRPYLSAERLNTVVGGMRGVEDDSDQITGPFLFTLNILMDGIKDQLNKRATIQGMQKAVGAFAPKIAARMEEVMWAIGDAENRKYVRVIPIMWVFGKDESDALALASRARSLWERNDCTVQDETALLNKVLLMSALPFGLIDTGRNITLLDRDFVMNTSGAAMMAPLQADYRGSGDPVLVFISRKGQVAPLDLFDRRANNSNFIIAAESGSGKSFLANYLLNQYYAANAKVRVCDIGYSYRKLAKSVGGRFMDFGSDPVVINPLDIRDEDQEDRNISAATAAYVIASMATSQSRVSLDESSINLIKQGVSWALAKGRWAEGIRAIREYLSTFPKHAAGEHDNLKFLVPRAQELAFNLAQYDIDGDYGRFFNGRSTFDISSDDFVVLELERLRERKDLFNVITMSVMNAVTQDLYLSDRTRKTIIMQDEGATLLKEGGEMSNFAAIYEAGYRRARKYLGSMGMIVQSPLDLHAAGDVGRVIRENSAFKFYLQGRSYTEASEKGLLPDINGFALDMLRSVSNVKPFYSEVFIDSPFGVGVTRLVVDPWTYWVNTSEAREVAAFDALLESGFTPLEALELLVAHGVSAPLRISTMKQAAE
jgi:conjugal transfer ATP-binding protein TraC